MSGFTRLTILITTLTSTFIGMKVAGAAWSWWWVFSPVWIYLVLAVGFFIAAVLLYGDEETDYRGG